MAQRVSVDTPLRMSFDAFVQWSTEETRAEWVDGEVVVQMPPSVRHQHIAMLVSTLLYLFVRKRRLGIVLASPIGMRLAESRSYREPDIVYLANVNSARLSSKLLEGPADLVCELISDESFIRDRRTKFVEYATSGIPEYWTIDARDGQSRIRAYTLVNGDYNELLPDEQGRIYSRVVPGFYLKDSWLLEPEAEEPLDLLAEIERDLSQFGRI